MIQSLSDIGLISKVKTLVLEERRITQEVLDHLREFERRRLYGKLNAPFLTPVQLLLFACQPHQNLQ